MKQIEMNGQYFEKLTSRSECAAWLKEVKESALQYPETCMAVYGTEGVQSLPDEGALYIEYLDGTSAWYEDGSDFKHLRTSNVKTMIYDGGYGYTFYNAVAQMDLSYPDMPYIRIGTDCHEYGDTVKM